MPRIKKVAARPEDPVSQAEASEPKAHCHLRLIADLHDILPISSIVIECVAFDTQKLKNPDIEGVQYQQGDQAGFWNVREYVLLQDGHPSFNVTKGMRRWVCTIWKARRGAKTVPAI